MKKIIKKVITGTCLSIMLVTVLGSVTAFAGSNDQADPNDLGDGTPPIIYMPDDPLHHAGPDEL